jgi:ABC-type nitrate/sulfonate/bicarbonate transport system substrate-binding protein
LCLLPREKIFRQTTINHLENEIIMRVRLALDWAPNANHSGIYAAVKHGWYQEADVDLDIQHHDFAESPATKLELDKADVALCSLDCLLNYRSRAEPLPVKAIAAVLQDDLASIAVLESSGIERPAQLDGKTHASYRACNKDATIECLVRNDGGKGELNFAYPDQVTIWNTLVKNKADSIWIFMNWQGVQAELAGVALRHFKMADYGIPFGYSPIMIANEDLNTEQSAALKAFLAATAKGYAWAAAHPVEMTDILLEWAAEDDKNKQFLQAAQAATSPHYISTETGSWGHMESEKVEAYLKWRVELGLDPEPFAVDKLVTNDLLG